LNIVEYIKYKCIKGFVFNKNIDILMDTGSDVNLKSAENCSLNYDVNLKVDKRRIFAANNTELEILGVHENVDIKIEDREFKTSCVVVKNLSYGCILGVSFLRKYCSSLKFNKLGIDIVWKTVDKVYSITNNIESEIIENGIYKNLFISEIKDLSLCKTGEHSINTQNNVPICKQLYRLGRSEEIEIEKMVKNTKKGDCQRVKKSVKGTYRSRLKT
jgi:hypothetical protein